MKPRLAGTGTFKYLFPSILGVITRLKHLYLLINALREMQADSFSMDTFYPLVMDVLRDAFSDVRFIASSVSPRGDWEEGLHILFSERPRIASQIIHLNASVQSGEVENPVRVASLLGTALPLLREFYSSVREYLEEL